MMKLTLVLISSILFLLTGDFQKQLSFVSASNSTGFDEFQYEKVLPCFDRTPHCKLWAKSAECRKRNALVYMEQNCPMTCNLCNPMFQPWTPNNTTTNTVTYESQGEIGILIRVGVDQKLDVSDTIMSLYSSSLDTENIRQRILDISKGQQLYLDRYYRDIVLRDGAGQILSSIDMDLPVSHKRLVPYLEECLNLHPYCFYWVSKGFCESKPLSMADICAPACQVCRWMQHDKMPKLVDQSESWFPNPFKRNDIMGIMDAIYNDRVHVDSMGKKMMEKDELKGLIQSKIVDDETTHILDIKKIVKAFHKGNRSTTHFDALKSVVSGEESTLYQTGVITLDNFVTLKHCNAIFHEIKETIKITPTYFLMEKNTSDYFPHQIIVIDENDHVQSKSSNATVFLDFFPNLRTTVTRLSMLLNIPLNHMESSSIVKKFEPGDFQYPTSHFKADDFSQVGNMSNLEFGENPVVFGVTIFLSSVKGGELFFPNMNNLTVDAIAGRAVIFPSVTSLIPVQEIPKPALDERPGGFFEDFVDKSYLIEEPLTFFGFQKVEEGTSYTFTVYFRRNPITKRGNNK